MIRQNWYKWAVLVALFLNVALTFGAMNVIAPLASEIDDEIGISLAQVGAAMSFFVLASPIFSPIAGVLTDRLGARWILVAAIVIVAVAGAGRSMAADANHIIALMFIGGIGFACVGPVIPIALSSVFPADQFGKANGIVFSGFWVGSTWAFALSAAVLSPIFGGWRATTIAIGLACALLAILWALLYKDPPAAQVSTPNAVPSKETTGTFALMIRMPKLWLLALFYACCMAALFSILGLLPKILENRGLDQPGMLAAVLTGAMVIFNVIGGMLSDRYGRKAVLIVSAIVFGATIMPLLTLTGWPLIICLALSGASAGPIVPVATAIPVEMTKIGPTRAGTALGIIFMIGNLGAFFGPIAIGWMMDISGSAWSGFLTLVVLLWVAPIFLLKLRIQ